VITSDWRRNSSIRLERGKLSADASDALESSAQDGR
jgi:hypothetical protein